MVGVDWRSNPVRQANVLMVKKRWLGFNIGLAEDSLKVLRKQLEELK